MRTRTPALSAVVLAVAGLLLATALPAQAARSDAAVTIGGAATLTVTGHGWGHGHGMSQYGAQGAARQGLTYPQILAFYYPGTQLSSLAGSIRVLITADTDNNTTVRHRAGLRVLDTGNAKWYRLRTKHTPRVWRLRTVHGQTRVYYRTARWHLYRTAGRVALKGAGEFRATGPLTLRLPSGDRRYRGGLRYVNGDTVNVVGMENYLKGVVPSEMPPSWQPAALQAQAVAARTYAARAMRDSGGGYYHLCDTSRCQVYRGYDGEWSSTNAAVGATSGRILTYQGAPAFTQFSSSSGGWTSSGSQPYLIAQPDIYDQPVDPARNIGDPHYNWTRTVAVAALQSARPSIGTLTSIQIADRDGDAAHPDDGWVLSIVLTGSTGRTATMSGTEFKSLYGLKSAYFSLSAP
jgi:stage II sporulation protein D